MKTLTSIVMLNHEISSEKSLEEPVKLMLETLSALMFSL